MARQVLTTTNHHGFNVVQSKLPDFGVSGYWVDRTNVSAVGVRFAKEVDIGKKTPTKCIFISGFARYPEVAPPSPTGIDRTYFDRPIIYFPVVDPTSPRNSEERTFQARANENVFSTPETLTSSGTLIRVPNGESAKIYKGNALGQFIGLDEFGGNIFQVISNDIPVARTFETFSYMTFSNVRLRSILNPAATRAASSTRTSNAKMTIKAGSVVFIYSVAINGRSVPDWSRVKNDLQDVKYTWSELSLNSNIDPIFNDSGFEYSTSLVSFTVTDKVNAMLFDPAWSGGPWHITRVSIYE